jgi:hypothetical protein
LSEVRNVTGRRCHLYPPILKKKTVLLISSWKWSGKRRR